MSRAAAVTGANGAIGRAIAETLAAEGWSVIGLDVNFSGDNRHLEREVVVDIADTVGLRTALDSIARDFTVTGLVNCAGIVKVGRFMDEAEPYWRRLIDVNLFAPIVACQALIPPMVANGGGAIVNITSDSGRAGAAGETVYSATKGGLAAFGRSLAQEVGRFNIRVNNVSPGLVDTPMSAANPELVAKLVKRVPLKRTGAPTEVARAVAYLLGPDAAYITGQTLSVSGGLTMAS